MGDGIFLLTNQKGGLIIDLSYLLIARTRQPENSLAVLSLTLEREREREREREFGNSDWERELEKDVKMSG